MAPFLHLFTWAFTLSTVSCSSLLLNKRGDNIVDNHVTMKMDKKLNPNGKILSGSFTVSDLKVHKDLYDQSQVAKGKRIPMDVKGDGREGRFNFRAARNNQQETANVWHTGWQFNEKHSTRFDRPKKLNFAFRGQMILDVLMVPLEGTLLEAMIKLARPPPPPEWKLILDDIGFAQGHGGGRNDWWFGGKNCHNFKVERSEDKKSVLCKAIDAATGKAFWLHFKLSGISEIEVLGLQLVKDS